MKKFEKRKKKMKKIIPKVLPQKLSTLKKKTEGNLFLFKNIFHS